MEAGIPYLKTALIALLFISYQATSEPLSAWGNESLPPMAYIEGGTPKGFGIEITQAVLKEAGIDFRFKMAPWKRAYVEAKRGNGLVFGMYWTEQRSKLFHFSKALWTEEIVLATKKGKEFPFQKIADLQGKIISMQRGTRPGTEFENALKNKVFIAKPNNNPVERVGILMHGQIDAAMFNPGLASVVWNARLAGYSMKHLTVLKKPLAVKAKHIGIAKFLKKEELINKIDAAINRLHEAGKIKQIMDRYENKN